MAEKLLIVLDHAAVGAENKDKRNFLAQYICQFRTCLARQTSQIFEMNRRFKMIVMSLFR
jgi:hypothetical protein